MKHVSLYEEYSDEEIKSAIGNLEEIGHEGLVGFMWVGHEPNGENVGFLVVGRDERDCVNLVLASQPLGDALAVDWLKPNSDFKGTFVEMLERLFEKGLISDAGHYAGLRARGGRRLVKTWFDPYMMNPKYCYDQAKEYFKNAEEVFSEEVPESKIYYPEK